MKFQCIQKIFTLLPVIWFLGHYSFALLNLSAFPTTETELKLMAAAANMGLNKIPKNG